MAWAFQDVLNVGIQIMLLVFMGWCFAHFGLLVPDQFMGQINVLILRVAFPTLTIYLLGLKVDLRDADAWRSLGSYVLWVTLVQAGIVTYTWLVRGHDMADAGVLNLVLTANNTIIVGLPVMMATFPHAGSRISLLTAFVLFLQVVPFSITTFEVSRWMSEDKSRRRPAGDDPGGADAGPREGGVPPDPDGRGRGVAGGGDHAAQAVKACGTLAGGAGTGGKKSARPLGQDRGNGTSGNRDGGVEAGAGKKTARRRGFLWRRRAAGSGSGDGGGGNGGNGGGHAAVAAPMLTDSGKSQADEFDTVPYVAAGPGSPTGLAVQPTFAYGLGTAAAAEAAVRASAPAEPSAFLELMPAAPSPAAPSQTAEAPLSAAAMPQPSVQAAQTEAEALTFLPGPQASLRFPWGGGRSEVQAGPAIQVPWPSRSDDPPVHAARRAGADAAARMADVATGTRPEPPGSAAHTAASETAAASAFAAKGGSQPTPHRTTRGLRVPAPASGPVPTSARLDRQASSNNAPGMECNVAARARSGLEAAAPLSSTAGGDAGSGLRPGRDGTNGVHPVVLRAPNGGGTVAAVLGSVEGRGVVQGSSAAGAHQCMPCDRVDGAATTVGAKMTRDTGAAAAAVRERARATGGLPSDQLNSGCTNGQTQTVRSCSSSSSSSRSSRSFDLATSVRGAVGDAVRGAGGGGPTPAPYVRHSVDLGDHAAACSTTALPPTTTPSLPAPVSPPCSTDDAARTAAAPGASGTAAGATTRTETVETDRTSLGRPRPTLVAAAGVALHRRVLIKGRASADRPRGHAAGVAPSAGAPARDAGKGPTGPRMSDAGRSDPGFQRHTLPVHWPPVLDLEASVRVALRVEGTSALGGAGGPPPAVARISHTSLYGSGMGSVPPSPPLSRRLLSPVALACPDLPVPQAIGLARATTGLASTFNGARTSWNGAPCDDGAPSVAGDCMITRGSTGRASAPLLTGEVATEELPPPPSSPHRAVWRWVCLQFRAHRRAWTITWIIVKNPLLWSLFVALLVNLSGLRKILYAGAGSSIYRPELGWVAGLLAWTSGITVPVSLFSQGVWMHGKSLPRSMLWKACLIVALKALVLGPLQLACAAVCGIEAEAAMSIMLLALCPVASTSFVIAAQYGRGGDLVTAVTLLGIVLLVPIILVALALPRAFGLYEYTVAVS